MRRGLTACVALVDEFAQKRTALREHLIDVPVGVFHRVENPRHITRGDILVEQVTHRIYEDHPRLLPFKRLRKAFGPQNEIKAVFERMPRHPPEALRKSLSITIVAAGAYFRAPGYWIPGRVCPLDCALVRHDLPSASVLQLCNFSLDCHPKTIGGGSKRP
jgi:hypothetical protein